MSAAKQAELPLIAWGKLQELRKRLIYVYYDIAPSSLWNTVTLSMPLLITELERVLPQDVGE